MTTQHISPLKRLRSYFTHVTIERVESEINGGLEVVLAEGRFMLNSPTATYSFEDKYTSFSRAFDQIADDIAPCKSALVLGLGLGSVPYMLQQRFQFKGVIDCVEIDPVVIKLAMQYYPHKPGWPMLNVHCADAIEWMHHNRNQYDLVIADVFLDTRVPESFHAISFLTELRRSVAPGGTLLFSRLLSRRRFERALWDNLDQVFPEAGEIDTGGNVILHYKSR